MQMCRSDIHKSRYDMTRWVDEQSQSHNAGGKMGTKDEDERGEMNRYLLWGAPETFLKGEDAFVAEAQRAHARTVELTCWYQLWPT